MFRATLPLRKRHEAALTAISKVDHSIQLLVKYDGKLPVVRPINLFRVHFKGDKFTAFPFDKLADEVPPQRYVLLTKIK